MKSIHPFPARMAPDIIDQFLAQASPDTIVLDPMCGSGTVLRKAAQFGVNSIGLDTDPLAILMTRVATRSVDSKKVLEAMGRVVEYGRRYGLQANLIPSIDKCDETKGFVQFWFAKKQVNEINAIVRGISNQGKNYSASVLDLLKLAVSKIIITKGPGASLAGDVSHSRPHRIMTKNRFDVFDGFERAVNSILKILSTVEVKRKPQVRFGDVRKLKSVKPGQIDMIVTSPPYLNAIDYLRGHKLSLVWLGHRLPDIMSLRATNVGAERSMELSSINQETWFKVVAICPQIAELPQKRIGMIHRYVNDIRKMHRQFSRVLKKNGKLHAVVGNSTLHDVYVPNSEIFRICGEEFGFSLIEESVREIPANKRYLPTVSAAGELEKRMRHEVVQSFSFVGPQ